MFAKRRYADDEQPTGTSFKLINTTPDRQQIGQLYCDSIVLGLYYPSSSSNITMFKFSIVILISMGMVTTTFFNSQPSLATHSRIKKKCINPLPVAKRVALTIKADKKEIVDKKTVFHPIAGKATVKPGDIIKYTVIAKNNSHCALRNLILKQPIPRGTNYLKDSATASDGAELLFSIDGGKTFSPKPTIDTQPVPPSAYNYLRWKFRGIMVTNSQVKTTYELQVK